MKQRVFVISGNHEQFADYVRDKPLNGNKKYVYVADVIYLRGIVNPHGVFIGTWRNRADILEIIDQLRISSSNHNPVLDRLRNEVAWDPKIKGKTITGVWLDEYDDSVKHAAAMMAKEIDAEVLRQVMNNGI